MNKKTRDGDCFGYSELTHDCIFDCISVKTIEVITKTAIDICKRFDQDTVIWPVTSRTRRYHAYNRACWGMTEWYIKYSGAMRNSAKRIFAFFSILMASVSTEILTRRVPVLSMSLDMDQETFREGVNNRKIHNHLRHVSFEGHMVTPAELFDKLGFEMPYQISVDWCQRIIENKKAHIYKRDLLREE